MAKILNFKRRDVAAAPVDDPLAIKQSFVQQELRHQLSTIKSSQDRRDFLLLNLAQICYMIFDLNCYQDPRATLSSGINTLFGKWCKSKNK